MMRDGAVALGAATELSPAGRRKAKPESKYLEFDLGGVDDDLDLDVIGDASWLEVGQNCFVHSPSEWFTIAVSLVLIFGVLYFFGLGLDLIGSGAKVMTGCVAGELFGGSVNPVAGVMIGILATVLLQSSSTTTSIVVGLVGAEDSLINVEQGIYMIMGANVGTTVTNTIVALGHFQHPEQLELAFAGATIHDLFNYFTVAILLPVEVATGYLFHLTAALVRGADTEAGEQWEGPVKKIISPLGAKILIANKAVTNAVAGGGSCEDFYPIDCTDLDNPTKDTCETVGLIACDKKTGQCPIFFDAYAGKLEDQSSGAVVFGIGIFLIFVSLFALVQILTRLLMGVSIRVIYKSTNINGYLLIGIGAGITMLLQSSSTTTSFVTPLVGMGALRLEQMYPITIGANLGTTMSALLSALATDGNGALQVALAHMMFNVTGMMIWYPIPFFRNIPVECARQLGRYARVWRSFTLFYIVALFFVIPLTFLGLSALFTAGEMPLTITGSILVVLLGLFVAWWIQWCLFMGGRAKFYKFLQTTRAQYDSKLTLPTDIDRAKRQIRQHQEYIGLRPLKDYERQTTMVTKDVDNSHGKTLPKSRSDPRALRKALTKLPWDMIFVKTGIEMLYYHTGLPEEYHLGDKDVEDAEDNEKQDSKESSSEEGENISADQLPRTKSKTQKELDMEVRLMDIVPLSFKISFLVALGLFIWALVVLYSHGGVATTGAGAFVTILFGLSILYCLYLWFTEAGRRTTIEYFRNYRLRAAYIQSLPRDMTQVKTELNELLAHYRLKLDEQSL